MARSPRERYGTVDLASADVVLAGTQELLPVLRAAAVRAGIDAARMRVIGVDDLPLAKLVTPALTTVARDTAAGALDIVDAVVAQLNGRTPTRPGSASDGQLVIVRDSA